MPLLSILSVEDLGSLECPSRTLKRKHAPGVQATRTLGLCSSAPRVLGDNGRPEGKSTCVSLGNANDPPAGKAIPNQERRSAGHPGATVTTNNEELGDIENVRIVRRWRTVCDQHEPCDLSAISDEKGKPVFWL